MPTKVDLPDPFQFVLRRLARKYPAVLKELNTLIATLEADERPGDKIAGVGYDTYKVRLKNPSAQKGKSGGFRVIYYIRLVDNVILLTIYSKSQQTDMSVEQIRQLIADIIQEYENKDANDIN